MRQEDLCVLEDSRSEGVKEMMGCREDEEEPLPSSFFSFFLTSTSSYHKLEKKKKKNISQTLRQKRRVFYFTSRKLEALGLFSNRKNTNQFTLFLFCLDIFFIKQLYIHVFLNIFL
jgi:hypothetical protein